MTPEFDAILKKVWEPKRKAFNAMVFAKDFGWTPCAHYDQCIGWCPECLEMKHHAEQMNRDYGEPK